MIACSDIWKLFDDLYDSHRIVKQPFFQFQGSSFKFFVACSLQLVSCSLQLVAPGHMFVSPSFPIHHSMLDVQCSMFIFSGRSWQKQLSAYAARLPSPAAWRST
jgi:hypothetical protein